MSARRSSSLSTPPPPPVSLQDFPTIFFEDGVTYWNSERLRSIQKTDPHHYQDIYQTINLLGQRSQRAQGINAVLTSVPRLMESPSHRLYLLAHGRKGAGILKVGTKKLFVSMPPAIAAHYRRVTETSPYVPSSSDNGSHLVEMEPLCVLDFYVCEEHQRSGHGHHLFECMLAVEGIHPAKLAIDRPSSKFLQFLARHFQLTDYVPQTSNFVVFNRYFEVGHSARGTDPVDASDSENHSDRRGATLAHASGGKPVAPAGAGPNRLATTPPRQTTSVRPSASSSPGLAERKTDNERLARRTE